MLYSDQWIFCRYIAQVCTILGHSLIVAIVKWVKKSLLTALCGSICYHLYVHQPISLVSATRWPANTGALQWWKPAPYVSQLVAGGHEYLY